MRVKAIKKKVLNTNHSAMYVECLCPADRVRGSPFACVLDRVSWVCLLNAKTKVCGQVTKKRNENLKDLLQRSFQAPEYFFMELFILSSFDANGNFGQPVFPATLVQRQIGEPNSTVQLDHCCILSEEIIHQLVKI